MGYWWAKFCRFDVNQQNLEQFGMALPLADPGGGAAGTCPPPQQDPFLSFSHTFLLKNVVSEVGTPPTGNPGSDTDCQ